MSAAETEIARAQALARSHHLQDALTTTLAVLDRDPELFDGWVLLAQLLLAFGNLDRASEAAENAVARGPQHAQGHYVLGRVQKARGELEAAVRSYSTAIQLNETTPEYYNSFGIALRAVGRREEAVAAYRAALRLRPEYGEAENNLANVLRELGAEQEARAAADQARLHLEAQIETLAKQIEEHVAAKRMAEAVAASREALRLNPDAPHLLLNTADLLYGQGQIDEALRHYEQAARLDPTNKEAVEACRTMAIAYGLIDKVRTYGRLARNLDPSAEFLLADRLALPAIQDSRQTIDESRREFERSLDYLLAAGAPASDRDKALAVSSFYLAYHGECDRDLQTKTAAFFLKSMPEVNFTAPHCLAPRPLTGRKIRIGFISRFLYEHSIGKTTRGLIAGLSRDRFRAIVLRFGAAKGDPVSSAIDAAADEVVHLPENLAAMREQIAALELDVLFYQDIGMEQLSYFLALSRLAPVQCVSFGHPNTTGIPNMDYFVSNTLFEGEGAAAHYSERLVLLDELPTLAYYYRPVRPSHPGSREAFGFTGDQRIYLCAQTLFKVHPDFDEITAGILRGDPAARVVFIRGQVEEWTEQLERRFARTMPDVADRIVFLNRLNGARFLELLSVTDVALDTLHFNGMNTSLEAFAMGAPVVTLPGTLQRSRHTAGMYRAMGIDDCIASSIGDYVRIALRLGLEPDFRSAVCEKIARRRDVLYENERVLQEFERFYLSAVSERIPA